jgi:hypothetical protein
VVADDVDFDVVALAAVVDVPLVAAVDEVVAPAAMPAPSAAVATRLAAPATTRARAAGRRRRGRFGLVGIWSAFMWRSFDRRGQRRMKRS